MIYKSNTFHGVQAVDKIIYNKAYGKYLAAPGESHKLFNF